MNLISYLRQSLISIFNVDHGPDDLMIRLSNDKIINEYMVKCNLLSSNEYE